MKILIDNGVVMSRTYQDEADLAAEQIKDNGEPVNFYTPASTDEVYNPFGELQTVERVDINGHGLLLNYKSSLIDGTNIQAQDAYILYTGDKPTNGMKLDHSGYTWTVIRSNALQPTSVNILYKVQVR